jgi:nitroreductase
MFNDDLYPIIFKRKSIRKFEDSPIDNILKEINDYIHILTPLYDIMTDVKIISSEDVKLRGMKKAPHYLAIFSEKKEGYLVNVGFMFQQMDLWFSANGIGSCWQGIPKPKKEILESSDFKFIILIAFGEPSNSLYRESISEFRRKPIQKITDIINAEELIEPARLAPSAVNNQPWYFRGNKNIIDVYSNKTNFLKSLLIQKYTSIDIGIAIRHIKIAAEHLEKKIEIGFDPIKDKNSPKGLKYFATIKI